jgi:autotransporter-associated beta strand protein
MRQPASAIALAGILLAPAASAGDGSWSADADGLWSHPANWAGGAVADGAGHSAFFQNPISAPRSVTLDSPRTVGRIVFNSPALRTLSGSPLTLSGPSPEIAAASDAWIATTLTGTSLRKTGAGTLTLAGPLAYSGATVVEEGSLRLAFAQLDGAPPLAYWAMNEGSGTVIGNSVSGSPNGNLINNPTWVVGPGGPGTWAVQFNGTNQYGEILPNSALNALGGGALSVSAWVKTSFTGGFFRSLVAKYGNTSVTPFCGLGWSNPNELGFVGRNTSGSRNQAHTGAAALDNSWHHLVGVREADHTMRIYLDGSLYASVAGPSGSMANTRPIQICYHLNSFVPAAVSGVGIWNRALTPAEVAALHQSGWSPAHQAAAGPMQVAAGAQLELAASRSIASLADHAGTGGQVELGSHQLTVGTDDSTSTFSGTLSGTGTLVKTGAGTLTLMGEHTHTGRTNVNGGTLALGGSFSPAARVTVGPGAAFTLQPSGILRFTASSFDNANTLDGTGSANFAGTFEIDRSQALTIAGASWQLVNTASSQYSPESFQVAGFTETPAASGVWTLGENGWNWTYEQSTGRLAVTPIILTPTVENRPPVVYNANSASLRGEVTSTGSEIPEITLFHGSTDGGTTEGTWEDSINLGPRAAGFSTFVTGLTPGSIRYFRARATNSAGSSWAPATSLVEIPISQPPLILINEIMASNQATLADDDGDFSDWIELYNPGSAAVDLAGWGLSDSASTPFKWVFPSGTSIPPDTHLLVWASGKNRINPLAPLHTNFSISAVGEILTLTRPDLSLADQTPAVVSQRDVSFGRRLDDPTLFAFFGESSPGAANTAEPLPERLPDVLFSHPAGLHNESFQLSIAHPEPGAVIIYTLDGSEPDIANLGGSTYQIRNSYNTGPLIPQNFTSLAYTGPFTVSDRSNQPNKISLISSTSDSNPSYLPVLPVKKATVVRARAYHNGLESPVATATYFVSASGGFNYPVPLVSLSVDEDGLFDYYNGIYVAGVDHVTSTGGRICNWGNFNRQGIEAERPAHFQFFENGSLALDQRLGLRVHGNCSRRNAFKSVRLHADRSYDAPDDLNHPFFDTPVPDATVPDNTSFRRLILRSPSINEVSFSRLYQTVSGVVGGRLRPVVKFLNGEYWGVSYLRDRLDHHHVASHYGLDSDNIVMVNIKYGHEVGSPDLRVFDLDAGVPADMDDFNTMRAFIIGNDMSNPALYDQALALLDMGTFIDHLILKIFAGDDHYAPEYIFWKARLPENDNFGDGRWRLMVKDFDSTLFTANYVTGLATGTHPRPFGYELFQSLLANPSFRNDFINRFADLLNSHFLPARFQEIIHSAYNEMLPMWGEMSARWNNIAFSNPNRPFTASQRDALLNWSTQHPPRQRLHLRQHFGLAGEANLSVAVSDPAHGIVRVNTIDIAGGKPGMASQPYPWTGTYFHNVPVNLTAIPSQGFRFAGWRLNSAPAYHSLAKTLTLSFSSATSVEAVFVPAATFHQWNFEQVSQFQQPSYTVGGAALAVTPGPATEVLRNTAAQGFESAHLRVNNPLGASLGFSLPSTGFEEISLSFRTRRSGQGAELQTLSYTLDGISWNALETYAVADANPTGKYFDFSQIPGTSNNPDFAIRIEFSQGAGGTAGNHRFDDLTLAGTPMPGVNLPPIANASLPARIDLIEGGGPTSFNPADWFLDPEASPLTFTATSALPAFATADLTNGQLVLSGVQRGETLLTLAADDAHNPPASATVRLLVHPAPHALATSAISFNQWDAATPERSYPPHMLFIQGTENDSSLTTELDRAYFIPHDDYAEGDTVGLPYNATQRTRINGLGDGGIAMINTGRGRDLGGTLMALDTRGLETARVGFTAGTVLPNTRVYAIRLQARIGTTGPFNDVLDGSGQPVEYLRNESPGHESVIGPADLPPGIMDQPYVQLLWRYYHVAGDIGARAELRLDDVLVTADTSNSPASIVFDASPSGSQSGGPLSPVVVRMLDSAGFVATSFHGPVTISLIGSGSLSGTVTVNAVNGIATFDDLAITGTGSHQLVISAAGLEPQTTSSFRSLALTELLMPRFIQGGHDLPDENNQRVPFSWLARIDGLEPDATYRFANRMVLENDSPSSDGAGNMIFVTSQSANWLRTTQSPGFEPGDLGSRHFTFTSGSDGSFTAWFITEPTGNPRFTPGNPLRGRLLLNDGAGGSSAVHSLTTGASATVIRFGENPGEGTAVIGQSSTAARRIAVLYADSTGSGPPLAACPVEITGAEIDSRYAGFYRESVATSQSHWGTIVPNDLPGGLQRFEIRSAIDGSLIDTRIEPEGFTATVNPTGGLAPIVIDADAGLPVFLPGGGAPWHNPANWSTGFVPNAIAATAIFNPPTVADRDVEVNAPVTLGTLRFNQNATPYRNRLRSAATGTLAFSGGSQAATLRVDGSGAGAVEIDLNTPVSLATDLILLVNHSGNSTDDQPGALRLQQSWTGPGGLIKQGPGMASLTGGGKSFTGPMLVEQGVMRVTAPAVPTAVSGVNVMSGGQLRLVSGGSMESPSHHHFGGGAISLAGLGRGGDLPPDQQLGVLGALRYDPGSNDNTASLANPIQLAAAADIHVDGTRNTLRLDAPISGALLTLTKSGGGALVLAGHAGTDAPSIEVQTGNLTVNGSHPAPITLASGTTLSGTGATGPISGAGTVSPGAPSLQAPSSAASRIAAVLSDPISPAGNATLVLHSPTPLPQAPTQIDLFLAAPSRHPGDRYRGGLRVPAGFDLAAAISTTEVRLFVADPSGESTHLGQNYRPSQPDDLLSWAIIEGTEGKTLEVLQSGPPTTYDQWRGLHFADPAERDDPLVSGPSASAANDGTTNLLRYAHDLGPFDPPSPILPNMANAPNDGFTFRFRFNPGKSDLAWIVRSSTDLDDWSGLLFDSRSDTAPPPDPAGWTRLPVPPTLQRQFLRLELLKLEAQ